MDGALLAKGLGVGVKAASVDGDGGSSVLGLLDGLSGMVLEVLLRLSGDVEA